MLHRGTHHTATNVQRVHTYIQAEYALTTRSPSPPPLGRARACSILFRKTPEGRPAQAAAAAPSPTPAVAAGARRALDVGGPPVRRDEGGDGSSVAREEAEEEEDYERGVRGWVLF